MDGASQLLILQNSDRSGSQSDFSFPISDKFVILQGLLQLQ